MAITPAQLAARVKYIGSSDSAAILGLSPWAKPGDILLQKLGQVPEQSTPEKAWIGTELEPAVRSMAAAKLGLRLVSPTGTFIHSTWDFLAANVDSLVDRPARGQPIVEIKTTGQVDDYGEPGSDQVPEHVYIQVQHQMMCSDAQEAHVAVLKAHFGLSFDIYHIPRSTAVCETMEARLSDWWNRHVIAGEPLPDTDGPSLDTLSIRHREPGKAAEVDDMLIANYLSAHVAAKTAEEKKEAAKAALLVAMGDAEYATASTGSATYTLASRKEYTVKACTYRTLRVKAAK